MRLTHRDINSSPNSPISDSKTPFLSLFFLSHRSLGIVHGFRLRLALLSTPSHRHLSVVSAGNFPFVSREIRGFLARFRCAWARGFLRIAGSDPQWLWSEGRSPAPAFKEAEAAVVADLESLSPLLLLPRWCSRLWFSSSAVGSTPPLVSPLAFLEFFHFCVWFICTFLVVFVVSWNILVDFSDL